jgi:hypothetical protein
MNPDVVVYDEGENGQLIPYTPEPTASQNYLWDLFISNLEAVKEFANGDPIHVFHNGDLTQGNKYRSAWVSTRLVDQIMIGTANMRPILDIPNVKSLKLSVGTEAHNFGEGSSEILVSEMLSKEYPQKNISVSYHGLVDVDGVTVDYAHHGPYPGSREWLKGNVARLYLRDLMYREIIAGKVPPRLIFRAHYHQYISVTETVGEYTSTLIITPSYSMLGDYAHKAVRSPDRITHGMVISEVIDGRLKDIKPILSTIDIRTKEKL